MSIGGFRYLNKNRKPVQKASRDESLERLERVIDKHEGKISEAFMEGVEDIRSQARLELLADRIEQGDIEGAANIFRAEVARESFQPLSAAISAAVVEGGRTAVENLKPDDDEPPIRGPQGQAVNFVFDATNPRLSQFAEEISSTRIREVSEDVKEVTRQVIREETTAGTNPLDTARRVRESVGLTENQQQSVRNFRDLLERAAQGEESAISEAESRKLRDRRFAIRQGMSQDQIDKQVERYRQRFIKHRSEVIGRTESIRSINGASRELMQSYVDEGRIAEEQVRRKWIHSRDERVRANHRVIPSMNPNGVGLNEAFETPLGPLMFPGDPQGLPENTIQCFLPGTEIDGQVVGSSKAFYSGEAIKLETRSGRNLSVTLNHPVLTGRGWVAAKDVKESDALVATSFANENALGVIAKDEESAPSKVEYIFSSLSDFFKPLVSGVEGMDFHGDAKRFDGDVEVVLAHSLLRRANDSSILEQVKHLIFKYPFLLAIVFGDFRSFLHFGKGSLAAPNGIVSWADLSLNRLRLLFEFLPLESFSFGSPAWFDSGIDQNSIDLGSGNTKGISKRFDARALSELIDNFNFINADSVTASKAINAIFDKVMSNRGRVEADALANFVASESILVELDDVIDVSRFAYTGHVYDLQTVSGSIIANGLISSNCRCTVFDRIVSAELLQDEAS